MVDVGILAPEKTAFIAVQYRSIRISSKIRQSDHKWKNHS